MDLVSLLIIAMGGVLACVGWRLGSRLGEISAVLRDWMDTDKEEEAWE